MSTFSALFTATALPVLFDQHAESGRVTYAPAGGSAVAVTAIVGEEKDSDDPHGTGQRRCRVRTITVKTDAAGIASPQLNAIATVDDVGYAVDQISTPGAGFADLRLIRFEQEEISRPNYRDGTYR